MTDYELETIARQGLEQLKERVANGQRAWLFSFIGRGGRFQNMAEIEAYLDQTLGANWLADEKLRFSAFDVIRSCIRSSTDPSNQEAVLFCTAVKTYTTTELASTVLPPQLIEFLMESGNEAVREELVKGGVAEMRRLFMACVQTRGRVCLCCQPICGHGPVEIEFNNQIDWDGLLKFYDERRVALESLPGGILQ